MSHPLSLYLLGETGSLLNQQEISRSLAPKGTGNASDPRYWPDRNTAARRKPKMPN
jgi:hypothetical protein